MPFGVTRFRKVHASWVRPVGTDGRSLLTQPMSALAHAIGTSGYSTAARSTQPQVASSNSPFTVSQSMPARPGMAIARATITPARIPMLAQVSRWISSGLTSSAPVAVAAWSRSSLSVLREVLLALLGRGRQRRGLHDGKHLAEPVLAERGDGGGDRPVVADALRGGDEHCRDVAVQPELLVGRVGRGEVVEHDLTVGNEDAHRVELVVADARPGGGGRPGSTTTPARRR